MKWTKAYRKLHNKEMVKDTVFDFKKKEMNQFVIIEIFMLLLSKPCKELEKLKIKEK